MRAQERQLVPVAAQAERIAPLENRLRHPVIYRVFRIKRRQLVGIPAMERLNPGLHDCLWLHAIRITC